MSGSDRDEERRKGRRGRRPTRTAIGDPVHADDDRHVSQHDPQRQFAERCVHVLDGRDGIGDCAAAGGGADDD